MSKKLTPSQQDLLGQAINAALEIEMAFKLYSYRVATPEQFMDRVGDLAGYYLTEVKKLNNGETENEG